MSRKADAPSSGFYWELPDRAAGHKPILAEDAYEVNPIVERLHSGAVMASLDGELTDGEPIRKLFLLAKHGLKI